MRTAIGMDDLWRPASMGETLRRLRERTDLSQGEFCYEMAALGVPVTQSTVSRWENDDPKRRPTSVHLMAAAHLFSRVLKRKVTVWDLGATVEEYPEFAKMKDLASRVKRDGESSQLYAVPGQGREGPRRQDTPLLTPLLVPVHPTSED